ncbi:MAG TPA: MFS transporter, partial [Chloroflexi bacterium]|nr:MFS transporter [Chloroflexota bacterium]
PLSTFFKDATIERLAVMLRQQVSAAKRSPLVALRHQGARPPFFLVHPLGGQVFQYRDLVHHLDPEQPFYAIYDPMYDEEGDPYLSIEEMAAKYVEAIQEVQPEGPYLLGGHSFGGSVAFEMARQLEQQGQEVAALIILDTIAPHVKKLLGTTEDVFLLAGIVDLDLSEETIQRLRVFSPEGRIQYILRLVRETDWGRELGVEWVERRLEIFRARDQASVSYEPQPFSGDIILIKADESTEEMVENLAIMRDTPALMKGIARITEFFTRRQRVANAGRMMKEIIGNPTWGWDDLCTGTAQVRIVPGGHASMLFEPNVEVLAGQLDQGLREALGEEEVPAADEAPVSERIVDQSPAGVSQADARPEAMGREKDVAPAPEAALWEKLKPDPRMRTFNLVWLGQLVSIIGSGLTAFALGTWIYLETGSATLFAASLLFARLPMILVAPLAGVIVDRFDRRRIMIVSDTGSALVTLAMMALAVTGRLEIWHVYVAQLIYATCGAFQSPAYLAAVTTLVPKAQYGNASGMMDLAGALGEVIAPVIAGALLNWIRLPGLVMIDIATYLFAVGVLFFVRFPRTRIDEEEEQEESFWRQIAYGWRYVAGRSGLVTLMSFFFGMNFVVGFIGALLSPLILSIATPAALGVVASVSGFGLLLGSMVMSVWGGPKRRSYGVIVGSLVMGLFLALMGVQSQVWIIAAAAFGMLVAVPIMRGSGQAILQSKVPLNVQGRVFAIVQAVVTVASLVAIGLSGPLADGVFGPMLTEGGALADSVGRVIGVGEGRGIGLIFIGLGGLAMLLSAVGYLYPRFRNLEDHLPDAIYDDVVLDDED